MEYQNAAPHASLGRAEARARFVGLVYLVMSLSGSLWLSGLFADSWQIVFLACALPLAFMGAKAIHDAVLVRMLER
jgi:hypothetical protein